jgi:ankyrin repeat protein
MASSTGHAILDARDDYGRTVLHEAALHENLTLISKLLSKPDTALGDDGAADIRSLDNGRKQPLHYACAGGHADAAALLQRLGADPNHKDGYGSTPLQVALDWHDPESEFFLEDSMALLQTLFNSSADPNIKDWGGNSALHVAVDNGSSKEIVSLLLDHYAEINAKGYNARSALHLAAFRDLTEPPEPTRARSLR